VTASSAPSVGPGSVSPFVSDEASAATFDLDRPRRHGWRDTWRSFRTAVGLGWRMEANWTDPLLFFIYSVAKPVSAALILVFMVNVISSTPSPALRGFVVVGSALWSFVISAIQGLAQSILEDRERYRMLKYVYTSPSDFGVVLLGRGVARVAVGAMGALIVIAVGVVFLGVPFDVASVDWPLLVVSMGLGATAIVAIGVMMAAVCLQTRHDAWRYPEAVAGALFLLVGAVFPLAVLPAPLQLAGLVTPLAWWMQGVRLALFPLAPSTVGGAGSALAGITGSPSVPPLLIVGMLLVTTAIVVVIAMAAFTWSEARAKDRGLLDQTSLY
jgi:ABC-2 type transport system permease protein